MKFCRVIYCLLLLTIIRFDSLSQTSRHREQDTKLRYAHSTLYYLSSVEDTLSSLEFTSEIKHVIELNELLFSVQTNNSTNLISIVDDQLMLDESRTPNLKPATPEWFYLFNGEKQIFVDYSRPTLRVEYNKTLSDTGRVFLPLEYKTHIEEENSANFVFDIENQLLLFSIPRTQSYISASLKTYELNTSYIQNQNSVPEACCAHWFYDRAKKQVVLFLRNGNKRNEYHAFAFQNGIPKPDKKVGQSYYHTKDWYELGLYRGKFKTLPDQVDADKLYKHGKNYDRLDSNAK